MRGSTGTPRREAVRARAGRTPTRHRTGRFTVLLPVLGTIAVALCGLLLFGLATARVGVLAVVVGVLAAVVPVAVVVPAFLWVDRWEPEPAKLLVLTFFWGAFVATLSALLINDTAEAVGDLLLGTGNGDEVSAVVSAPLVEEAVKALPIVALLLRRSQEFDGLVDGIVYAGMTSAGFAFTENIYYFGRAFAESGLGDGTSAGVLAVFVLRGVLAPFTHPLFTVLTGIAIGQVPRLRRKRAKVLVPVAGYAGAVLLHALWNAAATLGGATTFLNVYFLVMVPIFIGVLMLVLWQRRREQRIVAAALPDMATAGWIARSEIELLASLRGRRQWRRQARAESGRRAGRAVAAYQASVTEFAFLLRDRATRAEDTTAGRRRALLADLRAARAEAVRAAEAGGQATG